MPPMFYVLIASHSAEVCPTSNAKVRERLLSTGPEIPNMAIKNGVKIVAGPLVNREHETIMVTEAGSAEAIDRFILDTGLEQWNKVKILPSQPLSEGMKDLDKQKTMF